MRWRKELILTLGHVFMFAWSWAAIWVFVLGFLSPYKRVIVYVNHFGEATGEALLILIIFPVMVYTMASYIMDVIIRPLRIRRELKKAGIEEVG